MCSLTFICVLNNRNGADPKVCYLYVGYFFAVWQSYSASVGEKGPYRDLKCHGVGITRGSSMWSEKRTWEEERFRDRETGRKAVSGLNSICLR